MAIKNPAALESRLAEIERLLASDPATAEIEADRLLKDAPGHGMAQLFKGIARRLDGRFAAAIDVLEPLCQQNPDAPFAHLQLGLARRQSGDNEKALVAIERAVAANANFGDGWLALADLLIEVGDMQAADKAFMSYVAIAPHDPGLQQVGAALTEGRIDDADGLLRRIVDQHPTDVVALCLLADIAERRDDLSEAEDLLTRCIAFAPSYTRARHNLAVVYLRQNRATEALEHSGITLAAEPTNPEFRKLRAAILVKLMRYDESIDIYQELLDEDLQQPTVLTSLGHMLKTVGRRDEAVDAYRQAIAQAPKYGEPYWSLANLKTNTVADDELNAMRRQLEDPNADLRDRLHFHFALGRALEDRQKYEQSFEHYDKGNRIRLGLHPYDPQKLSDFVKRCKTFFSAGFFERQGAVGSKARDPIFVLGLPRSGSTLVEQILASHSLVEGTSELPDIAAIASRLDQTEIDGQRAGYPDMLAKLQDAELAELGESYIEQTRVHRRLGKDRFVDKMPHNFAHIGLIHSILPNAKIIDIRRHPLACGLSLYKEHFAQAQNFSYSLEYIGRYYRDYLELMAHFDKVLPGRVHHVIYETLVDDTDDQVKRLLDYCELDFEDACLSFHENRRAVGTASSEQVRKPIYTQALEHWRNYEPWLGPLKDELGDLVDDYAATTDLE